MSTIDTEDFQISFNEVTKILFTGTFVLLGRTVRVAGETIGGTVLRARNVKHIKIEKSNPGKPS
jgi:hypothetical protein